MGPRQSPISACWGREALACEHQSRKPAPAGAVSTRRRQETLLALRFDNFREDGLRRGCLV
jgi:hypothetical protein